MTTSTHAAMIYRSETLRRSIPDCLVIYSVNRPLDEVVAFGPCVFVSGPGPRAHRSEVIVDPTWMDAVRCLDILVKSIPWVGRVAMEGVQSFGYESGATALGFVTGG